MTKEELIQILEPFTDDIRIIMSDGEDIISASYMISDDGEGMIVLFDSKEIGEA